MILGGRVELPLMTSETERIAMIASPILVCRLCRRSLFLLLSLAAHRKRRGGAKPGEEKCAFYKSRFAEEGQAKEGIQRECSDSSERQPESRCGIEEREFNAVLRRIRSLYER